MLNDLIAVIAGTVVLVHASLGAMYVYGTLAGAVVFVVAGVVLAVTVIRRIRQGF